MAPARKSYLPVTCCKAHHIWARLLLYLEYPVHTIWLGPRAPKLDRTDLLLLEFGLHTQEPALPWAMLRCVTCTLRCSRVLVLIFIFPSPMQCLMHTRVSPTRVSRYSTCCTRSCFPSIVIGQSDRSGRVSLPPGHCHQVPPAASCHYVYSTVRVPWLGLYVLPFTSTSTRTGTCIGRLAGARADSCGCDRSLRQAATPRCNYPILLYMSDASFIHTY